MVLVPASINPCVSWTFEADIHVLSNSTTFKIGYQTVIQCMTMRQCAQIMEIYEKDVLRTGESARVKFQFMYRPEYLKVGMRMVLREAHCKGIGIITAVQSEKVEDNLVKRKKFKLANVEDVGCKMGNVKRVTDEDARITRKIK